MKRSPSHRSLVAWLTLAALGVINTACGGGGGSDTEKVVVRQTTPPNAASAASAPARLSKSTSAGGSASHADAGAPGGSAPGTSGTTGAATAEAGADDGAGAARVKAAATSTTSDTTQTANTAEVLIYVETGGSDAASGTTSTSPVKTLARAQQIARTRIAAMLSGSELRQPVRVLIGPGDYHLSSPLTFTTADSGTEAAPVSYEARLAGTVLISGGLSLGSKTAPTTVSAVSFTAPADAAAMSGGNQLYVNGRRAVLARQPNTGEAWFVQKAVPLSTDAAGSEGAEAFAPSAANLSWISALSASDKKRAVVDVMQAWADGRHRLSELTTPAGSVRVAPRAKWPFLGFGVSQRYHVENVVAALDAPGEWIYESSAVRYVRRDDEAGKNVTAILPVLDRLIVIQGESATKPVQSLQFAGLQFAHTRYLTPDAGFTDGQGAVGIGAAIEVNRARHFFFINCRVAHTGGWGLWLREGVRGARVTNSVFTDVGAGGIKVGLTSQSASDLSATGGSLVSSNTISETGKLFPGAKALWLGQTWDNQILRNTIYNTSYTAISVGWSWGYADATSGRNTIRGNLIYNIGQRQLADLSGIYTLGRSPGTVISNNIIRSVRGYTGYGAGAWGIYNDEGSSSIVTENNVILGTDSGAYHLNYGRDNTVRGNVMAGGTAAEVRVTQFESGTNLAVQGNLLLPKTLQPFDRYAEAPSVGYLNNEVSPSLSGPGLSLEKCGTGCTVGGSALQASTAPTDIQSTNTTWSKVIANAVASWTGYQAGAEQAARISAANLPPVTDEPIAIVAPFVADIAGTSAGGRPSNLTYIPRTDTTSIQVQAQADAPAGKCMVFNDNGNFANRWEPFSYAKLTHLNGVSVVEFELKIDAATVIRNEWRDDAPTYLTGPTMTITSSGVNVGGNIVAPITVGAWTKFRITATLGSASGTWKLEVTGPSGQKTIADNLLNKDGNWRRLNWLGFISDSNVVSKPCLASLKATSQLPQ